LPYFIIDYNMRNMIIVLEFWYSMIVLSKTCLRPLNQRIKYYLILKRCIFCIEIIYAIIKCYGFTEDK